MTGLVVKDFGGVIPRVGSRLLPPSGATVANNAKLYSGELRSWQLTSAINVPSKAGTATLQSLYRMYGTGTYGTSTDAWLTWPSDVDAVRGPVAGDTSFRLYFTGDTTTASNSAAGPRKTNINLATSGGTDYPHDWLEMGVPAPGAAPTVIGTGGTSTTSVTRTYVYTYVTGSDAQGTLWSEEGPPSPLGTGTGKADAVWCVSALSTGTTGKYAFAGATKNLYRTLTDNAGNTNYQLVANMAIATSSYNDSIADGSLGVISPTFTPGVVNSEWVGPPANLSGLIGLPNGILVGFSGNLICFCEPFQPHAWPIRYQLASAYPIVSLGHYGQTLIVTTKGFPYAVIGARPDSMAMQMIEENHPCVSKRGTVSFSFGVSWPTPDGLALAGVGGALNAIDQYMKRDEWQAQCFPSTIFARQYLDTYFGFFNNGSSNANFVFDRSNKLGPLTFGNFGATGAWTDPETSKMYLIQNGVIGQWDADSLNNSPFDWKSKTMVFPRPMNFAGIQVDADYGAFGGAVAAASSASAADFTTNSGILGGVNQDTSKLTVWGSGSTYGTAAIVKSVDGVTMAVVVTTGTSSSVEPTWPGTLGGSATDGTVVWKRVWQLNGVTKGEVRGVVVRDHVQWTTADPVSDGTAGNMWGFPLRGSLLQGGKYPNYLQRYLHLQVWAQTTGTDVQQMWQQDLVDRTPQRLPYGFKSDTWQFELSGNINVRYFKVAETIKELGKIGEGRAQMEESYQ